MGIRRSEKPDDPERDGIACDERILHVRVLQLCSRIQTVFTELSSVRFTPNKHQDHSESSWLGKADSSF